MRLFVKFIQLGLLALALSSCFDFDTKKNSRTRLRRANSADTNPFNFDQANFTRYGYDIIWQDNLDGLDHLSLDELVSEYNRIGYQLYDSIINEEPITDGEELKEALPPETSEDSLKQSLRKSIWMFKWIFSNGLSRDKFYDANNSEANQEQYYQNLRVNSADFAVVVEGFDDVIDYSAEFNQLCQSHHVSFAVAKRRVYEAYNRVVDRIPEANLDQWDTNRDRHQGVRDFFNSVEHLPVEVANKAKFAIYKVYLKLEDGDLQEDDLLATAEFVLHGGWHCNDRKKGAIEAVYSIHCRESHNEFLSRVHQNLGADLKTRTRAFMKSFRRSIYDSWVKNRATNSRGDQASSYSFLYNTFSHLIGLKEIHNTHRMPITNHAYYYDTIYPYNKDEMESNFLHDFVLSSDAHNDLQRIKGYSPKDILGHIHGSASTEMAPNPIKDFIAEIWGPLLTFDESRTKNLYAAVLTKLETFTVL